MTAQSLVVRCVFSRACSVFRWRSVCREALQEWSHVFGQCGRLRLRLQVWFHRGPLWKRLKPLRTRCQWKSLFIHELLPPSPLWFMMQMRLFALWKRTRAARSSANQATRLTSVPALVGGSSAVPTRTSVSRQVCFFGCLKQHFQIPFFKFSTCLLHLFLLKKKKTL